MKRAFLFLGLFLVAAFGFSFSPSSPARATALSLMPAAPQTNWTDAIISTPVTWTAANSPYILGSQVTIANHGSLTIESGVIVQSPENSGGFIIEAGGQLNAVGATFTAIDPTKPWDSIIVNGGVLRLNHCDIAYAKSSYSGGMGVLYLYTSDVQVRNTRIHDNNSNGVNIAYAGLTPLFENVTIDHNTGVAIYQFFITAQPVFTNLNIHDNTGGDYLEINNADVDQDTVLDATGLNGKPIVVNTNFNLSKTLTIIPGAEIRMVPGNGFFVQSGGKLVAEGTAASSIRFTAVDPAHPWNVIMVNTGGILRMDHCDIAYAKSSYSGGMGVLYLYTSDVQVRNTRIHDNNSNGVNIAYAGLTPLFENVTIDHNTGVAIYQFFITAQPVFTNLNIHDNTGGDYLLINNADVDQDTVLDATGLNGKPIIVNSNINLSKTLTIIPGAEIRMVPGNGFFVQTGGKLVAEGTAASPIRFTAVDPAHPWNVIMVNTGGSVRLDHCDISNANSSYSSGQGVLYLDFCTLTTETPSSPNEAVLSAEDRLSAIPDIPHLGESR